MVITPYFTGSRFEQGTFCVSECQPGFQTVGRVCEPCPNGVCVGGRGELLQFGIFTH